MCNGKLLSGSTGFVGLYIHTLPRMTDHPELRSGLPELCLQRKSGTVMEMALQTGIIGRDMYRKGILVPRPSHPSVCRLQYCKQQTLG